MFKWVWVNSLDLRILSICEYKACRSFLFSLQPQDQVLLSKPRWFTRIDVGAEEFRLASLDIQYSNFRRFGMGMETVGGSRKQCQCPVCVWNGRGTSRCRQKHFWSKLLRPNRHFWCNWELRSCRIKTSVRRFRQPGDRWRDDEFTGAQPTRAPA